MILQDQSLYSRVFLVLCLFLLVILVFFFFKDPAPPEISPLPLPAPLRISAGQPGRGPRCPAGPPGLARGGVAGQSGVPLFGLGRAGAGVARQPLPPVAVRPERIAAVLV